MKEPLTNAFPYRSEQPQTCFALINKLSPIIRIVLKSKAMKQVISINAIAYTFMNREAILKLGIPQTKICVHLTAL